MKIILRIFPANRRGSFSSREIIVAKSIPTVNDIFELCKDLDKNSRVARGITYLKNDDKLEEGEVLNIIPV
jgi:hypothetical protein